ncbi:hypothetical protein DNTS_005529 [Danionella cerebrum]|uniref:peptidylprolyl isomerase n=1 Tax=Danionella cerebrum TaxID=2873325 RepID=A0A553NJQ6_9TELE|nr:hypothetical protein DNTS_005529 [Danionella translucida]
MALKCAFLLTLTDVVWGQLEDVIIDRYFIPGLCPRDVQVGDFVRYHYTGALKDGKTFDSSLDKGFPFIGHVGVDSKVIPGLNKGVQGMCVNERRKITIPPHLGYGVLGAGDVIPPHATLVFDLHLLDLWNKEDKVQIRTLHRQEKCKRTVMPTDFVRYHYNGSLLVGDIFETSYSRNSTYNTFIGMGHVIAGVDKALEGVCVGERRRVTVPPHLAYGETGSGELIPGSAVLVFDLHVIDFHNPKDKVFINVTYKPSSCDQKSDANDLILYRYNCSLLDGTLLYSSDVFPEPTRVMLGQGKLISGLDDGLQGMCLLERREITVPPHLAHGSNGAVGIPSSAVLLFEVELLQLQKGVPEGFLFIWVDDGPDPLFPAMDINQDQEVPFEEFETFIKLQVTEGRGRIHPGVNIEDVLRDMFRNQDRNGDGKITEDELNILEDEEKGVSEHVEL